MRFQHSIPLHVFLSLPKIIFNTHLMTSFFRLHIKIKSRRKREGKNSLEDLNRHVFICGRVLRYIKKKETHSKKIFQNKINNFIRRVFYFKFIFVWRTLTTTTITAAKTGIKKSLSRTKKFMSCCVSITNKGVSKDRDIGRQIVIIIDFQPKKMIRAGAFKIVWI